MANFLFFFFWTILTELLPFVLLVTSFDPESVDKFEQYLLDGSVLVLSTHTLFDASINDSGGTEFVQTVFLGQYRRNYSQWCCWWLHPTLKLWHNLNTICQRDPY